MGVKRKSGEFVEHLFKEELAEEIKIKEKRVEILKQTLKEKKYEARGLKRKIYDFVTHSFKDATDEDEEAGKESVGSLIQSFGKKRSESGHVKGEKMLSPDVKQEKPERIEDALFQKTNLATKSADQRSGNARHISKMENSLWAKLMEDSVARSTEYLNHLIQLEIVEMEVVKSEDWSEKLATKELARDKEEENDALEEYDSPETAKKIKFIVPSMINKENTDIIDLPDGNHGNLVTQKRPNTSLVSNLVDVNAQITYEYEIKLEEDNENKNKVQPKETGDEFAETDYYDDPADTVEKDMMNHQNKEGKKNLEKSYLGYLEFLDSLNTSLGAKDIEKAQKNYAIRSGS